jgi:ELWxxDGT repeat protein
MTDRATNTRYSRLISVFKGYRYVQYSAGLARTEADSKSPRLESLVFSFIHAGVSPARGPESVVTDRPAMLSRTEWGCPDGENSASNPNPSYTDVTHLIVHHTATSNAAQDWAAEVRAIWSYHVQTRGWADIGYNFLVDPNGTVYVGRAGGDNVLGAHFTCQNGGTQGISLLGNFTDVAPTRAALNGLEGLLAWLASREGLDPAAMTWHEGTQLDLGTISGHRDGNSSTTGCTVTACPGDTFYPMLPEVRVNVEALIAEAQVPDPVVRDQQTEIVARFTGNSAEAEDCWGVFEINGHVLGNLHTAGNGCRLYRFDESGDRVMLADINTAPSKEKYGKSWPAPAWPGPPFNGWAYFEGASSSNGYWRTDGISVETVVDDEDWPRGGVVTGRGQMNGRLYFTVESASGEPYFFSTDGRDYRSEPVFAPHEGKKAVLAGSFYNTLLFVGSDQAHGEEPRLFDGSDYSLLADIVAGAGDSGPEHFLMLDDDWLFVAQKPDETRAFFKTDGHTVTEVASFDTWVADLDQDDPALKSRGYWYMAGTDTSTVMDPFGGPTSIMRLDGHNASSYDLGDANGDPEVVSMAALGDEALVMAENRIFRLGETSAEEVPYNFPTDQTGSAFEFIGSNPYFPHAYVEETNGEQYSRVWAWSEDELGLLMAGEANPVTRADHFVHIGEGIWFYGEDAVNGRALRRISAVAEKPTPWMAAITGAWYDPATSGQGLVLHPIDNTRSVVSFYGYENDGTQLWLLGTAEAPIELGVESEIILHVSSGGNFGSFLPIDISTVPWGTLRVTFRDCRSATAMLEGDHGLQALELERLAGLAGLECKAATPQLPRLSGVTGTWYDPATSGQGLVLHAIDENRILVSFYGYRDDSSRLWLLDVYEGEAAFGKQLTLNLTRAVGGRFGPFDPLDIERSTWGTMTIEFRDCETARATLEGADGQQVLELIKLAGLNGSGRACPPPSPGTMD